MAYERPIFTFTLPFSGETIRWRPINAGAEMDIRGNYRRDEERHLIPFALLAARILPESGGGKAMLSPLDLREWDADDVNALSEEVALREAERAAALSRRRDGGIEAQAQRLEAEWELWAQQGARIVASVRALAAAAGAGPLR